MLGEISKVSEASSFGFSLAIDSNFLCPHVASLYGTSLVSMRPTFLIRTLVMLELSLT